MVYLLVYEPNWFDRFIIPASRSDFKPSHGTIDRAVDRRAKLNMKTMEWELPES